MYAGVVTVSQLLLGLLILAVISCTFAADQADVLPATASDTATAAFPCSAEFGMADSDMDSISDLIEGRACQVSPVTSQLNEDTDGDKVPDYLDLDSDNDGRFDLVESGSPVDTDLDLDGKCDNVCVLITVPLDSNSDGTADYADFDLDESGITEIPPVLLPPVVVGAAGGSGTGGIVLSLPSAHLLGITLSSGTLTPAFSENVTSYTASVGTSTLTVTPYKKHSGSSITVNDTTVISGNASGSIALSYGTDATITIIVTAIDSTTKTYTITATLRGYSSQEAYVKASNTDASDRLGWSVAISGDTLVVGAYQEGSNATGVNGNQSDNSAANSGAAYVFVRNGTTWSQQAYLKASNAEANDQFGFSVAISGDTLVIGAHQEDSSATGVNGNQSDNSADASGATYVFVRSGTTWSQQAYLKASNTGAVDLFGYSVAITGDTLVVGAYQEGSNATGVGGNQSDNSAANSGAAYVFTRSGTTWSQQAYLKASNTGASDAFGYSVAISGDTIIVGAYGEGSNATGVGGNQSDNSATNSGAAYVFVRSGTTWSQQAYLKASNSGENDMFGVSVTISEDTLVVGGYTEDSSATGVNGNQSDNSVVDSGSAYVFVRSGTTWSQQAYLKASNSGASDQFGYSVAISGDTLVVGAIEEGSNATGVNGNQSNNSASGSGAAYVFMRSGTTWSQQAYLKASNSEAGDIFGSSVAMSGDTIVVGAYQEDSSATGINGNQSNNGAADSGATYVFVR